MISGITKQIGGKSETFRMTTRAMMAIEDHFGKGLIDVMQGLEKGFRVTDLALLISECANDGAGGEITRATEIMDEIGVTAAGELLGEVAEAAFPDAKGQQAKNVKRAVRQK
ncbi:GTA-gp10 family protein [Hoeflea sp.]|uniref:GTA-gp10 family protein n=1 Tax=Hoeflea sp. TaxID=1940281 RepID=UPI0019A06FE3|nr:GTA-gp10 family protein [Hoeflea sp.]MBC7285785.1 hypothetical protein [Hoeflea sp.]